MDIRTLIRAKQRTVVVWAQARPVMAAFIGIAIVWTGTAIVRNVTGGTAATRYVLASVTRGTLVQSVSGTGQVVATRQIDLKPKSSGDVVSVSVAVGQHVKEGQLIAQLDATDEIRALQAAQADLDKLQRNQPLDTADLQQTLTSSYDDAFALMSDAFLQLPDLINTAHGVLYDNTLGGACSGNSCQLANLVPPDERDSVNALISRAASDYATAKASYDPAFATYQMLRRSDGNAVLVTTLDSADIAALDLTQALKSEENVLDAVVNSIKTHADETESTLPSVYTTLTDYQKTVSSAISSANGIASRMTSQERTISSAQRAATDASSQNPLDLATQQRAVQQARQNLADRSIRAPFSGTLASLDIARGDSVSSATVGTLIADSMVAEIQLNEVDVAGLAVGQKATSTFDAVSGLTLSGTVTQVDPVGTVSQGVVSYTVQVAMDTQDARVKAGMTTSVSIVTAVKSDVLLVPGSAVRMTGGSATVEVVRDVPQGGLTAAQGIALAAVPERVTIRTGASSDSQTEVTSGLNEGDIVVTRTISSTTTTAAQTTGSQVRLPGTGGGFIGR